MPRQLTRGLAETMQAISPTALACRVEMHLPLVSLSTASIARNQVVYQIDQRLGPIAFSIAQCGLLSAQGHFARFTCDLRFDRVDWTELTIDLASIALSEAEAPSWQKFTPWFDLARYPLVRFRSSAVAPRQSGRYSVRGLLEISGVTQLQALDAVVVSRQADPITRTEVAEWLITGGVRCLSFGMPADEAFISDRMELRILGRIELET